MAPNDTIKCNNPGHCKNHPIVQIVEPVHTLVNNDTTSSDTLPIEVTEIKAIKKIIHYSADSIQPVDVSLLSESTYHTFKIHEVRNQPEIEEPMNIDLLCNSVVLTFMLALTAKYAIASTPSWINMFMELKQELS